MDRWEELISEFLNADEMQQTGLWTQADIALAVRDQYGGEGKPSRWTALQKFASEVGRSTNTLWQYARTAEAFPDFTRVKHLSFTHHRIAANHCPDPESAQVAICRAADELWSTRELQEFLVEAYTLKVEGEAVIDEQSGIAWLDGRVLAELLSRFDGLRVRLQVKVVGEEA